MYMHMTNVSSLISSTPDTTRINALAAPKEAYREDARNHTYGLYEFRHPNMYIPVNGDDMVASGRIKETERGPCRRPLTSTRPVIPRAVCA